MSPEQSDKDPKRPAAVAANLPDDPEVLRTKIDETRAELGDTVEALTAKADVKGQIKEKVEDKKEQLRGQQERVKGKPLPFAVGGVVALIVLVLLRRRGRR